MDYQLGPGPLQVDQNTIDEKIKGDIGIVENGVVATHAIAKGYYVIWKGDLYIAKTDISSGTTLSASSNGNLTAKPSGLGAEVAALNSNLNSSANITNDILADAVSVNGTKFFNGSGGAYTGDVPGNNYKYGIFTVMQRWSTYFVVAHSAYNEIAINYYNGSSWLGWQRIASSSKLRCGIEGTGSIPAESAISKQVTFSSPMPKIPSVTITTRATVSTKSNISKVTYNITNVTTSGFTFEAYNSSNAALSLTMNWIAVCE